MKFWVRAKGESFEEQLLVGAESTEELKRKLEELLHVVIRQMSVIDFQTQVLDKISSGSDIIIINLRTEPLSGASASSGGLAAAGADSTQQDLFEGSLSSRDRLIAEGSGSINDNNNGPNALTRTSSSSGLLSSSGIASKRHNSATVSDLFHDVILPVDRICLKREELVLLLSPVFRGQFVKAVQGCFVRVRGAFSLGSSASGYATVQIASVTSETQLALDLVHVVEVRHIDAVSNSPPTSDEVKSYCKHMISAGRPLLTNTFIEGKAGDVEEAMRAARAALSPQPPAPLAEGAPSRQQHQALGAPTTEQLKPVEMSATQSVPLDEGSLPRSNSLSKVRRRTALLQPSLLKEEDWPPAVPVVESPSKQQGVSPNNSGGVSRAHQAIAAAHSISTNDTSPGHPTEVVSSESRRGSLTTTVVVGTPQNQSTTHRTKPPVPVVVGGVHVCKSMIRVNDALLNGWMVRNSNEEGEISYSLFGTRHANPKAKRPRLSDFSGLAMLLQLGEGGGIETDRDVTIKGYVVYCVPQLWRGAFWALGSSATACCSSQGKDGAKDEDGESPATSPERRQSTLLTSTDYEFLVLSGRDPYSLYNPTTRTQLPMPSWGAPLSQKDAALSPQLIGFKDALHVFYLVLLRSGAADGSAECGSETKYGLAHAYTREARIASSWHLLSVDAPIATGGYMNTACPAQKVLPLFHVSRTVGREDDSLSLLWLEGDGVPPVSFLDPNGPLPASGSAKKPHRRRSPSITKEDVAAATSLALEYGTSPLPTPPIAQDLAVPSKQQGSSTHQQVHLRYLVNCDDAIRTAAWTPHDIQCDIHSCVSGTGAAQGPFSWIPKASCGDEWRAGGIKCVSLFHHHVGGLFVFAVGEDHHRRATAVFFNVDVK